MIKIKCIPLVVCYRLSYPNKEGYVVFNAYNHEGLLAKLAKQEAERVAAKAKETMEKEKLKWNLAETLLNMKRDENGALVPKVKVDE